jgi:hypothetical protein
MGTNALILITDENFENVVSSLTVSNVVDMLEMISSNSFLMHELRSKIRLLHETTGLNTDSIEILASDLVDKCFDIVPEHAKEIVCEHLILIIRNISTTIISLP